MCVWGGEGGSVACLTPQAADCRCDSRVNEAKQKLVRVGGAARRAPRVDFVTCNIYAYVLLARVVQESTSAVMVSIRLVTRDSTRMHNTSVE